VEDWRTFLYPLGFLSSIAFGARFIVQWLQSEKHKASIVTPMFWYLSLLGNVLLAIHSFIQIQYHICLVQVCNGVISWRNLNLMQSSDRQASFQSVLKYLGIAFISTSAAFFAQDFFLTRSDHWFRIPIAPWQSTVQTESSIWWHALGIIAYLLFSSRFWIQWWLAEKSHSSKLPLSFWWLSLMGAVLSIIYFSHIQDSVNLIGPLIGIIPYIRNLMLIKKNKLAVSK
jgi:lipid-A-disaccharide synthase